MNLQDSSLFRQQCYIDGAWVDADSGATVDVTNPATGETIGTVPRLGADETRRAIEAADAAYPAWRAKTAKERAGVLRKWFELMLANLDDLAVLMTAEQGKPMAESRGEIAYAASFLEWFAEEGKRAYGDVIPQTVGDRRIIVTKEPVGVVASITPWNFPSAMITRKVGPALAAGCTIVAKPATATPYSATALAELAERAGVPAGVFSVVTGSAGAIGGEMTSNPIVRKITFTGSTEVGKQIAARAAASMKRVSLELGGHAPFLVLEDADPVHAAKGAALVKFLNTGQACICPNRIFVHEDAVDAFTEEFVSRVGRMRAGNGLEDGVQIGPLVDEAAVAKVERQVADAAAGGAEVLCGGRRMTEGALAKGTFYAPTVLAGVAPDMLIYREETFGPVAPIIAFRDEGEALAMANDTHYGLASYVYTRDIAKAFRMFEGLNFGIVGINDINPTAAAAPFGGSKESGLGREGGHEGIAEYLETKLGGFSI